MLRHPRTKAAALLLAAGLLQAVHTAPAAAAPVAFASTVINQSSSLCAAVPGGAPSNALQLTQETCAGAAAAT